MLCVPIHRQNSLPIEGAPPVDFTLYSYPYHNFPTIVSHVHPRFVLCNAGLKIVQDYDTWEKQAVRNDDIANVFDIWTAWCKQVRPTLQGAKAFFNNPHNGGSDLGDNNSEYTTNHRRELRKRKLPEQQGSPAPKSSKRPRPADDGAWLDDETLREFDRQASTRVEDKKQLILEWLTVISTTAVKEDVESNDNPLDVITAIQGAL